MTVKLWQPIQAGKIRLNHRLATALASHYMWVISAFKVIAARRLAKAVDLHRAPTLTECALLRRKRK